tara:strand:+ start:647 stop:796 length:150 start_codon:yes stop_codon:yes gene_type:complete
VEGKTWEQGVKLLERKRKQPLYNDKTVVAGFSPSPVITNPSLGFYKFKS